MTQCCILIIHTTNICIKPYQHADVILSRQWATVSISIYNAMQFTGRWDFHTFLSNPISLSSTCVLSHKHSQTHLLHHDCGSIANSERPREAVKAKGHASSMRKETSRSRTGKTVTDMSPICRDKTHRDTNSYTAAAIPLHFNNLQFTVTSCCVLANCQKNNN